MPVSGAIGVVYQSQGGVNGPLGTAVGMKSDGPVPGSRLVSFDAGAIIAMPATGTHALSGAIWDAYRLDPDVRSRLGVPTSDEIAFGDGAIQYFQGGSIVRSAAAGTIVSSYDPKRRAVGHRG